MRKAYALHVRKNGAPIVVRESKDVSSPSQSGARAGTGQVGVQAIVAPY